MKHVLFISFIILFIIVPGLAVAEKFEQLKDNASVAYCDGITLAGSDEWAGCLEKQKEALFNLLEVLNFAMEARMLAITNPIMLECLNDNTADDGGINFSAVMECVDDMFKKVAEEIKNRIPKTNI